MEYQAHGNLPEELTSFVGRERELRALRELVRRSRAVTLCGAAGIGKTRLAVRLLAGLAGDFPDGAWLIELADLAQPDLVVSRIAAAIEVVEEPGRLLLETLADALRPRRLLIALDNCEHLIDACARICQRLLASSPGLRVIATSREPLRIAAESVWQVPPLSRPATGSPSAGSSSEAAEPGGSDALQLFAERAATARPGFVLAPANAAAVLAVCQALDGLPLAIELAAAWVRMLPVEQIEARLDDRFQLLTTGEPTAPLRQRTLRAAIDWSHDLLTEPGRVLLRRLSVFADWSLEMAEQVCSGDGLAVPDILDLLTALADKSLVVADPGAVGETRYRMLNTVREYAAARLAEAGESATIQVRFRDYTLREVEHLVQVGMALIRAPWSATVDVFRRFDAEADNLRLVLSRSLADRDAETGLRICAAMRPVWIVRGSFAEGADWLDSFLGLDAPACPAAVRGAALIGRAQLALASDPARAEEFATAGLELCRAAGEKFFTAAALNLLTEIALHAGHVEQAAARAEEAQAIARKAGDRWNEGYALGTRAAIAGRQGDLREARQLAEAALAIMRDIDHQWGAARTLLGLGDLARLTGDPEAAQRRYIEALATLREVNAWPEMARCLAGLGRIAMDQGDLALARQRLAESIGLSHSIGSRIGVIRALDAFAALAIREATPDRAVQLAAAAGTCRVAAQLPPARAARTQRILAAAADLGEPVIGQLWATGSRMSSADAVALALDGGQLAGAAAGREADVTDSPPGGLTPREREVAALIAEGRTNTLIARELSISPATAARHVTNILGKLGFSSRTQIAAWASAGRDASVPPAVR
jgi:predicted ATPase/DNA-binding CsgD family transcriptional regulator